MIPLPALKQSHNSIIACMTSACKGFEIEHAENYSSWSSFNVGWENFQCFYLLSHPILALLGFILYANPVLGNSTVT